MAMIQVQGIRKLDTKSNRLLTSPVQNGISSYSKFEKWEMGSIVIVLYAMYF